MIVSQLDPRGNIVDRLVLRGVHHSIHSLVLERGVEGFCPRIVPAHSGPPHGRADTIGLQVVQELLRRVLAAPPLSTGHLLTAMSMASHTSEVRTWLGHRIPHDFLGAAVQNSRKINEPGPRADVGDVALRV